uniref:Elongation factor Ts, mitochondrial n=1 Tax=Hucho hucho TaxID=62062 RepID=A0A4W5Q5X3_9TELE
VQLGQDILELQKMSNKVEVKELLEAGVHFGHMTRKWDPNMAPYIYMERNGIHIINLYKTAAKIEEANEALKKIAASGRKILFVATKKQAKDIVAEKKDGTFMTLSKKERLQVDPEHIAIKEAQKLNIPVFAMVDTNSDPREVDYVIPANDDASKSIDKILSLVTASIIDEAKRLGKTLKNVPKYISYSQLTEEVIKQAEEDAKAELKAEGKPEQIWDKIIPGKVQRFISDNTTLDQEKALLDQNFIKDDSKKVSDYVKGFNVEITGFKRVTLG